MQESTLVELEKLFLALSDKTRLRLLALMADGEVPVGFLAETLDESQPKISRHLAYLRSAGLVSTRREGKWIYYGIEKPDDAYVTRVLDLTLRSILADDDGHTMRSYAYNDGDAYRPHDEMDTSSEAYISDWAPAEMEIFLL